MGLSKPIRLVSDIDNPARVLNSGKNAREPFKGTTTMTKTFTKPMNGFSIYNEGDFDLTITILGDVYTVKAGTVFREDFPAFTDVIVTATGAFSAYGLGI